MADLSITSGSGGSQSTTSSPQSLVNSGASTESASKVQPGTATSVLTNGNGISLGNSQLSTIDLNNTSTGSVTVAQPAVATVTAQKHHVNIVLLSVCAVLFIAAIATFFIMSRAEKNTTNYY